MSIRIAILWLLIVAVGLYAWKDWFKGVCGLVLLMAVLEHPDMPKFIAGIQGLNPWNVLMANILLAWAVSRRRESLVWDMPRYITVMLMLYLGVIVVGFLRMVTDPVGLAPYTFTGLLSEHLINCVKWVIPGLLLFDGCRTKARLLQAVCCILGMYLFLAVQVIKYMPAGVAMSGDGMSHIAMKICSNDIGYHRVNLSMLLSGASWGMLAAMPLSKRKWHKLLFFGAFLTIAYGQALTGGRMGYVTWGLLGLILCLLRWRRLLLFLPIVPIVIGIAMPGVTERMLIGFGETDVAGNQVTDDAELSSDRTLIWPVVIDKFMESPAFGYGRMAMIRTGLRDQHSALQFPHPHNAYLEWILDNGLLGFLLVMPFYLLVVARATPLFLDRNDPYCSVIGGVALTLTLALLIASMGSQSFYPREGALGMWAAIGLMFRVSLARSRVHATARNRCTSPNASFAYSQAPANAQWRSAMVPNR